jgi:hypothetical protein
MQTKTYNIYTFDELDEKAKEKARDWWKNGNDYPFLSEYMNEYAMELLKDAKIKAHNVKVYYSLSCCQGDGAMIELDGTWKSYSVTVKQSGHYSHYNSKTIDLESSKTGKDASEDVYNEFNDIYVAICKKLERSGYAYIDSENEDENVEDIILVNEYTFLADGTRHD